MESQGLAPPPFLNACQMKHPQLPLGLELRDNARFESFYPGENEEVVGCLRSCAGGPFEPLVFVAGAAGLGKTHLLQAACHHAAQFQRSAVYLPLGQAADMSPGILDGLEQMDLACLDDIDAIAGQAIWEQGLFDFFNRARDAGHVLLVSASMRADRIGFELPDLVSRLGWGVTYLLKPLDDETVLAAMMARARGRGLELPEETARYLLHRFPRNLGSLFALFDELDRASLVNQRRLTIPFVKAVLEASS